MKKISSAISFLVLILFLLGSSEYQKPISPDFINQQIENMLSDIGVENKKVSFEVLKTITCNNITAVAIKPPYREFPNVIIFYYDDINKHWKRIKEGLWRIYYF